VLQEREFSPLGSDATRQVDVRVIAATNRSLPDMVTEGTFREDLYYRLDVYTIHVPPLRERIEDVPQLAAAFLAQLRVEMDKHVEGFDPEAMAALCAYSWPGNVRELRNAVERALLSCRGDHIGLGDLPERVHSDTPLPGADSGAVPEGEDLDAWMAEQERRAIIAALDACGGVQAQAARRLGITERSLWHRIKKLDIKIERTVREN
jgi:transcriptional regulator with PAS, ATPase and Fis domain